MSRLGDIPIRIEPISPSHGLGAGGVNAILYELASLLEKLVAAGEPAAIDLRSLPMSAQDRSELRRVLGEGEVQATLRADGISKLQETRVPGVWWIEHRDRDGELLTELLEVTYVPQILPSGAEDIAAGARLLRAQLAAETAPAR